MTSQSNQPTTGPVPPASGGSAGIHPGDKVGKFEIVEQIGAGGMSVVWKAYDSLLDRHLAVKQLAPDAVDMKDDALHERFRREAAVQKRLSENPHLVKIIDFIDEPRGLFIIMEYVEGQSLEDLLRSTNAPLEERQALGIVAATAAGLKAIHEQGIIHRDLKPANILLPTAGGLKICDFGLATLLGDQETMALGTVRYMAPELSTQDDADGRADLYSLGMIAYEMLAGRAKFEESFRMILRDSRNQALRWMKWHANPRAKATPLDKLNPAISPTLSELVGRLMEKDPAQRISTPAELLEAMRRHFAGAQTVQPAAAAPKGPTEKPAAPSAPTAALPKPSRTPYILAAIMLAQVVLMGGLWLWSQNQEKAAARAVERHAMADFNAARKAYDSREYETARAGFAALSDAWPDHRILGRDARAFELLASGNIALAEQRYDQALKFLRDASDMNALGMPYRAEIDRLIRETASGGAFAKEMEVIQEFLAQHRYDLAKQRVAEQRRLSLTPEEDKRLVDLSARIQDQQQLHQIDLKIAEANKLVEDGKVDDAIKLLEESKLEFSSRKIDDLLADLKRDVNYAQALGDADRHARGGRLADAIRSLELAQRIKPEDAIAERIKQYKGQIELQLGQEAERAGNIEDARGYYTRSLGYVDSAAARTALDRLKTADQKAAFLKAGDDAVASGDYEAAIAQYENALKFGADTDIRSKVVAARVSLNVQRSRQLLAEGKLEEAREALAVARQLAPDDREVSTAMDALTRRANYQRHLDAGDNLRSKSRFGEAKREFLKARDVMETPEVKQRIDDTEYDYLVAQARHYIENQEWSIARALLRSAAKVRSTPEIRRLMEEVAKYAPPLSEDER